MHLANKPKFILKKKKIKLCGIWTRLFLLEKVFTVNGFDGQKCDHI